MAADRDRRARWRYRGARRARDRRASSSARATGGRRRRARRARPAPAIQTTGAEPDSLHGKAEAFGPGFAGAGTARFQAGTCRSEVIAMTGPAAGQAVETGRRMPQRLAISSTSTVAAVRSALGRSPGRTTMVARRRSMRDGAPVCAPACGGEERHGARDAARLEKTSSIHVSASSARFRRLHCRGRRRRWRARGRHSGSGRRRRLPPREHRIPAA